MPLVKNHHFLAPHQPKKLLFFLKQNFFKSLVLKDAGETAGVSRQAMGTGLWLSGIVPKQKAILSKLPVVPECKSPYDLSSRPNSKNKS